MRYPEGVKLSVEISRVTGLNPLVVSRGIRRVARIAREIPFEKIGNALAEISYYDSGYATSLYSGGLFLPWVPHDLYYQLEKNSRS